VIASSPPVSCQSTISAVVPTLNVSASPTSEPARIATTPKRLLPRSTLAIMSR